jgi:hypothetical protein
MPRKTDKSNARTSRRAFLVSSGALAAGMYLGNPTIARAAETLAVNGGKPAVTAEASGATSWPLFGEEECKAVEAVVHSPGYGQIAAFEEAWKAHFKPPYCKSHMNGTSALVSGLFG